ncbi:MAG: hypothetical protein LV480_04360 [Methylacidiphilales bacterium]|nr:hypothetical protein [Candidatus Methylacidiphilales bacterium]
MTLNVSLKVPDGIVIASDSLMTLTTAIPQKMNVNSVCPKCNEQVELKDVQLPPVTVPSSTFPYAQKVFDIKGKFALAVYGSAFINNRSMYSHVMDLNAKLPDPDGTDYFDLVANKIKDYFDNQMNLEAQKVGLNLQLQLDTWHPFGFQFAGFTKDGNGEPVSKVSHIQMGKESKIIEQTSQAFVTGDHTVVSMLWPKGNAGANFAAFSLQDAIDYAKFLIRTTADYQRFSGQLPKVGGEIDIALVTHRLGFKWIAQKELYRMLEK